MIKCTTLKNTIMRKRINLPSVKIDFQFPFESNFSSEEEERAECIALMPVLLKLDYKNANFN